MAQRAVSQACGPAATQNELENCYSVSPLGAHAIDSASNPARRSPTHTIDTLVLAPPGSPSRPESRGTEPRRARNHPGPNTRQSFHHIPPPSTTYFSCHSRQSQGSPTCPSDHNSVGPTRPESPPEQTATHRHPRASASSSLHTRRDTPVTRRSSHTSYSAFSTRPRSPIEKCPSQRRRSPIGAQGHWQLQLRQQQQLENHSRTQPGPVRRLRDGATAPDIEAGAWRADPKSLMGHVDGWRAQSGRRRMRQEEIGSGHDTTAWTDRPGCPAAQPQPPPPEHGASGDEDDGDAAEEKGRKEKLLKRVWRGVKAELKEFGHDNRTMGESGRPD